jgi:hypothetical protein
MKRRLGTVAGLGRKKRRAWQDGCGDGRRVRKREAASLAVPHRRQHPLFSTSIDREREDRLGR